MSYRIDTSETAYFGDADELKLSDIVISDRISIKKDEDTITLLTEFIMIINDTSPNSYDSTLIRLNKEQAAILGRILIELSK